MILDIIFVFILVIAGLLGRKKGLFSMIMRLSSFVLSFFAVRFFKKDILLFFKGTEIYKDWTEKITLRIGTDVSKSNSLLFGEFAEKATELVAEKILETCMVIVCFFALYFLLRFLIVLLDRTILKLPVIRPVNQILGCVISIIYTGLILFLIIGLFGNMAICSSSFVADQMQKSTIIRYVFENNFVLNSLM